MQTILTAQQLNLTLNRLAHQLIENEIDVNNTVFIGLQPRGVFVSHKIVEIIKNILPNENIQYGILDITFYRDDVRQELHYANKTDMPFSIDGKKVILIDDVLFTGRTIRAALDALQDFGRAKKIELCVLIDRKFNRELPIQPNYFGKAIDSSISQKVKVNIETQEVVIY